MQNNNDVNNIDAEKNCFDEPKFAVKTQEDQRERNDAKLPDPKTVSVECDNRTDDRIDFAPAKT